jgi:hypothetical protein
MACYIARASATVSYPEKPLNNFGNSIIIAAIGAFGIFKATYFA